MMKILITGAHFTPAQAVIEELKKQKNVEIVYIGRKYTREGDKSPSVESQVLPSLGVKFIPIAAGRIRRSLDIYTLFSLIKIPIGFIQAFYCVFKEKPDVVVSFGGYVGVPVVISAWLLSIPVIVHEQTLITGLANQVSNLFANKVAVTFDNEYSFKKEKIVVTGNPIREEIIHPEGRLSEELDRLVKISKDNDLPLIYITGGNQGSHIINETVSKILDELTKKAVVIHQTGDSKYQDFEKLVEQREKLEQKERYVVKKWVDGGDLGLLLKSTDLVISRAGANTLLELSLKGVPTIIIPLPFVLRDEQTKNAKFFAEAGLGEVLLQSKLNPKSLLELMEKMLREKDEYSKRGKGAKEVVVLDAAKKLAQEILILGKRDV